ncbi:DUF4253 domain-containing protein [Streptomyces sp. NPDC008163]|uniref:DUF4253 domain-containing protein n=1 Tax=Streptomyces sp. NPDC008163 TaxID=3364818 RepID=UPI0036ED851F
MFRCRQAPLEPERVGAVRLEDTLAEDFAAYRRERLCWWTDTTPVPVPEGIEPWPHDPGPPFEVWPGLAPGTPPSAAQPEPEHVAASLLGHLVATRHSGLGECRLVLVPARHGSDVLAAIGWTADAPLPLLCALLRSWEERFGARLVAVYGSEPHVVVQRPPTDADHTGLLALEHVLTRAGNIVDDPPTPFPDYAADLAGRAAWSFWWD